MDTTHWRRLMGHSLFCAWLLWQGLEVWAGPPVAPGTTWTERTRLSNEDKIVNSYESKDDCLKAALTKRNFRNAILRRYKGEDQVSIEVWACLPTGAPPEKARFE